MMAVQISLTSRVDWKESIMESLPFFWIFFFVFARPKRNHATAVELMNVGREHGLHWRIEAR